LCNTAIDMQKTTFSKKPTAPVERNAEIRRVKAWARFHGHRYKTGWASVSSEDLVKVWVALHKTYEPIDIPRSVGWGHVVAMAKEELPERKWNRSSRRTVWDQWRNGNGKNREDELDRLTGRVDKRYPARLLLNCLLTATGNEASILANYLLDMAELDRHRDVVMRTLGYAHEHAPNHEVRDAIEQALVNRGFTEMQSEPTHNVVADGLLGFMALAGGVLTQRVWDTATFFGRAIAIVMFGLIAAGSFRLSSRAVFQRIYRSKYTFIQGEQKEPLATGEPILSGTGAVR